MDQGAEIVAGQRRAGGSRAAGAPRLLGKDQDPGP